jgi:hypothetical protein
MDTLTLITAVTGRHRDFSVITVTEGNHESQITAAFKGCDSVTLPGLAAL